MKKRLTLTTLIFSLVMFSSPSYAEWTKVGANSGGTFYADYERIRKVDGYVYFWELTDFLKPQYGMWSVKVYQQGDCKLFRYKSLNFSSHKEPMGEGRGAFRTPLDKWKYPPPNSAIEIVLKKVCKYAKWTKTGENPSGDTFYVDFERIRKVDGYVYFWRLSDYLKPMNGEYLSAKIYSQGDCKLIRHKTLTEHYFTEPMGGGTLKVWELTKFQKKWMYPPPNSITEDMFKKVCEYAN